MKINELKGFSKNYTYLGGMEIEIDVKNLQERLEGLSRLGLITFTQTMQPRDLAIIIASNIKDIMKVKEE